MVRQYTRTHPAPPSPATWVVVADSTKARMFRLDEDDGLLTEFEGLSNPSARLQTHEAKSDRAGRTPGNSGGNSAFEPRQTFEEHVSETFAKRLGLHLSKARHGGIVGRIYLLADPAFLGHIRSELDEPTRRIVVQELAHDLVQHDVGDIRRALPAHL